MNLINRIILIPCSLHFAFISWSPSLNKVFELNWIISHHTMDKLTLKIYLTNKKSTWQKRQSYLTKTTNLPDKQENLPDKNRKSTWQTENLPDKNNKSTWQKRQIYLTNRKSTWQMTNLPDKHDKSTWQTENLPDKNNYLTAMVQTCCFIHVVNNTMVQRNIIKMHKPNTKQMTSTKLSNHLLNTCKLMKCTC